MTRGLRELGVYLGTTYVALLLGATVAIWVFDFYEPKFGGRLGNLVLFGALWIPVTLVAALGYAIAAYLRDRRRTDTALSYRYAVGAGVLSAVVSPLLLISEAGLTDDAHTNLALTVAYVLCVGALTGWLCALIRKFGPYAA